MKFYKKVIQVSISTYKYLLDSACTCETNGSRDLIQLIMSQNLYHDGIYPTPTIGNPTQKCT